MQRVLLTGASGGIGTVVRHGLRGCYPILRLTDIAPLGEAGAGEELVNANLCNLPEMQAVMDGVDAVVHLGGTPEEAPWEQIHANNIVGLYNTFEAARRQGVRRIVFASSNHVIGFYRRTQRVGVDEAYRPDTRYGVSKVFGEAIGRLYADKYGLEVVCLRIGSFRPRPTNVRMLSTWISHRDMVQLVRRSLDARGVHFDILYGVSRNDRNRWDNPNAKRFGYHADDNAEEYAAEILKEQPPEDEPDIERLFHGGPLCSIEFDGDATKIE